MTRLWAGLLVLVASVVTVRADDAEDKTEQRVAKLAERCGGWVTLTRDETQPGRPVVGVLFFTASSDPTYLKKDPEVLKELAAFKHLRRLELVGLVVSKDEGQAVGGLESLESLTLTGELNANGAKGLTAAKKLQSISLITSAFSADAVRELGNVKSLTALSISRCIQVDTMLKEIAGLKNVTTLSLSGDRNFGEVTDAWVKALAPMENLTDLELLNTKVTTVGVGHLAAYKKLTRLSLEQSTVQDFALKELGKLTNLTALNITHTEMSGKGMKLLAPLTNLAELHIGGLENLSAAELKGLTPLTKLKTLDLRYTPLKDDWLKGLVAFKELTTLELSATDVTDAGVKELSSLKDLTTLNLRSTKITDAGVKGLTACPNLSQLDLTNTRVTAAGVKELGGVKKLTRLSFGRDKGVTGEDLKALSTLKGLTELRIGQLEESLQPANSLRTLRDALPKCKVVSEKPP